MKSRERWLIEEDRKKSSIELDADKLLGVNAAANRGRREKISHPVLSDRMYYDQTCRDIPLSQIGDITLDGRALCTLRRRR